MNTISVYNPNYRRTDLTVNQIPVEEASFEHLDFNHLTLEEILQKAVIFLEDTRKNLKETMDADLRKEKSRVLNNVVMPFVITTIFLVTLGAVTLVSAQKESPQAFVGFFTLLTSCFTATIAITAWHFYPHPGQQKYDLIGRHIILLQSSFCIDFLKEEENKNLYPSIVNLEFGDYLRQEMNIQQERVAKLNALDLRKQLIQKNVDNDL